MKINVRKCAAVISAAAIAASAAFFYSEQTASADTAVLSTDLITENVTITSKALKKSTSNSEAVRFTLETTDCTDEEDNGSLTIRIENGSEDDTYSYSITGGQTYKKMNGRTAEINNLAEGSYSVCVIKNKDKSTISDTLTVYIGSEEELYPVTFSVESFSESIYNDGKITVRIDNFDRECSYEATVDGGKTWTKMKKKSYTFSGVKSDIYSVCVRLKNFDDESYVLTVPVLSSVSEQKGFIETEAILQNPELPTGCEITSLTMLLNHIGFKVDKLVMADNYLPKGEYRNADFNEVFVGNPREYSAYGCFSNAIVTAAESFLDKYDKKDAWEVRNITGCPADALYRSIDSGNPVVVWASGNMDDIYDGASWVVSETGKALTWPANEHCLLLTGYDKKKKLVYFNDPMKGQVSYDMALFEQRFEQLNNNAVIIVRS